MTIEEQVTNLEISKRLKELGVKQESLFYWRNTHAVKEEWHCNYGITYGDGLDYISAFTVAELGELLNQMKVGNITETFYMQIGYEIVWTTYENGKTVKFRYSEVDKSEANARAKMIIYLIENKFI